MFAIGLPDPAETGLVVTDLYRWDGAFVKRLNPGLMMSVDGRYGVDQRGVVWSVDGKEVGGLPDGGLGFQWADDGPNLCRINTSTGQLVIADVHGKILHQHPLVNGGPYGPILSRCDVASDRAVLEYQSWIDVVSVADAHVIGVFASVEVPWPNNMVGPVGLPRSIVAVSPDARWLARVVSESPGQPEIDVVSLVTGATSARLAYGLDPEYGSNLEFSADGDRLIIGDANGPAVRIIDWRSHRELWSRPGLSSGLTVSDRSANRVLVEVWNGQPGANTTAYWIVDPRGQAIQFTPRPFNATTN